MNIPNTRRDLFGIMLAGSAASAITAPAYAEAKPGTLVVIAEIFAKTEHSLELRSILISVSGRATQEHGCLSYALYEDRDHTGHFYTYETWINDAALDEHLTSPEMKSAASRLGALLMAPPSIHRMISLSPA